MTMESPKTRRDSIEEKLRAFIDTRQDYKEANFSQDELREATSLMATRIHDSHENIDDEMIQRMLDARLDVRKTVGKIPVLDNEGGVIGMADSIEKAKKMTRQNNETRDTV